MSNNGNGQRVTPGQTGKEDTINAALGTLDQMMTELLTVNMSVPSPTLALNDYEQNYSFVLGANTAAATLTLPAGKKMARFTNASSFVVTLAMGATQIVLPAGVIVETYSDGTANGLAVTANFGSVPVGGLTGQLLAKRSKADLDVSWIDPPGTAPIYTSWRVRVKTNNGGAAIAIGQLIFRDLNDVVLPTTGGTVLDSSQNTTDIAATAFDGTVPSSTHPGWYAATNANEYLGYTFGQATQVVSIQLLPAGDSTGLVSAPLAFAIEGSNDGQTWTDLGDFTATAWVAGAPQTFIVPRQLAAGGSGTLAGLTDVDESTPPTDGQALLFSVTAKKWKPGTVASASTGSSGTSPASTSGYSASSSGKVPATYSAYRLTNFTTDSGGPGTGSVSISELKFLATDGVARVPSTNATNEGSNSYPAANVYDGNDNTHWASVNQYTAQSYIQLGYAAAFAISGITIDGTFEQAPHTFDLYGTNDGGTTLVLIEAGVAFAAWPNTGTTTQTVAVSTPLRALATTDLGDVDETTPPTDGQALLWNAAANKFKPGTVSAAAGSPSGSTSATSANGGYSAKSFRIAIPRGQGYFAAAFARVEMLDPSGNPIPWPSGTTFDASDAGGGAAANAFDADATTYWATSSNSSGADSADDVASYIEAVMPSLVTGIGGVAVTARNDSGASASQTPSTFILALSQDGTTQTAGYTCSGAVMGTGERRVYLLPPAAIATSSTSTNSTTGTATTGKLQPPTAALFTDYSVYGRGAASTPPTLTDNGASGLSMTAAVGDKGFHTALRPIPSGQVNGFEFIANIAYALGQSGQQAHFGIDGICFSDAQGNVQLWGLNGGNSGREGIADASYYAGGGWNDGDYSIGASSDGPWFRMLLSSDGTSVSLFRSTTNGNWGTAKETYTLSSHNISAITRYGFFVHNYDGAGFDTLTISAGSSTEFPYVSTKPTYDQLLAILAGGAAGQSLKKNSATDYDFSWQ